MRNKLLRLIDIAVLVVAAPLALLPLWNISTSLLYGQHVAGPNWLMLVTAVVPLLILAISTVAVQRYARRNWKYLIGIVVAVIFFLGWVAALAIVSAVATRIAPQLLPSPSSTTILQSFGLEWLVSAVYLLGLAFMLRAIGRHQSRSLTHHQ